MRRRRLESRDAMGRLTFFVISLLVVGIIGGAAFLATWDIPAPATTITAVIPDERFQR